MVSSLFVAVRNVLYAHLLNRKWAHILFGVGVLVFIPCAFIFLPRHDAPRSSYVSVENGTALLTIADTLEKKHIISSSILFRIIAKVTGVENDMQSGEYLFAHPPSMFEILYRMRTGAYGIPSIRVTIPEGYTSYQIAELMEEKLPNFDGILFSEEVTLKEGYLFPDTYEFAQNATTETVIDTLLKTFTISTSELQSDVRSFGKSFQDVVIMASIIEREALRTEDRRIIAGILWKRITIGMGLQVDAVFGYIHKRETFNPTFADLEVDSLYNTYKYRGLPPGPISNPGLDALRATITPIETPYLYYLTGRDGVMRYARTFDEHKQNRRLYLD